MAQRKSIAEKVSFEIENHTTCLQNDSASEKGQIHFFGLSVILKVSDLAPSQIEHPVRGGGGDVPLPDYLELLLALDTCKFFFPPAKASCRQDLL